MIDTVCILAGGLGTRLRALYADRPKALVPVCGKPFIEHMVERLRDQGISRIHIAAGYRAGQIKEWSEQHGIADVVISVSVEPAPLGTAGGIKHALPYVPSSGWIMVLNGDSLLPHAGIQEIATRRREAPEARAIIAAVEMTERGQYGTLDLGAGDRVVAFREKAEQNRGWVNGGIYYLDRSLFADMTDKHAVSMEKELFPALAAQQRLYALRVAGPLLDMGTPEGLEATSAFLAEDNKP